MFSFIKDLISKVNTDVSGALSACVIGVLGIIVCLLLGKFIEKTKKENINKSLKFSEKHPTLNALIGLCTITIIASIGYIVGYYILYLLGALIVKTLVWLKNEISKLDAVVIVALITGAVSIVGVIISSIIAKIFEFKKSKQEYLTSKRESPYGEFVEMVYNIQQNVKNPGIYTNQMMLDDLSKFSRQITLWGSQKVVNKWVKFRENGAKPNAGEENLFVLEDIMNEMRKDLGLKKVKKGNLLAFFVNDIKKIIKKK